MNYYNYSLPKPKRNKSKKKYYILNHFNTIDSDIILDLILDIFNPIDCRIHDVINFNMTTHSNGDVLLRLKCRIYIDDYELKELKILDEDLLIFKFILRHQNMTIENDQYSWRKTMSNETFRQHCLKHKLLVT